MLCLLFCRPIRACYSIPVTRVSPLAINFLPFGPVVERRGSSLYMKSRRRPNLNKCGKAVFSCERKISLLQRSHARRLRASSQGKAVPFDGYGTELSRPLITSPPGAGKTTLVSSYIDARKLPACGTRWMRATQTLPPSFTTWAWRQKRPFPTKENLPFPS